MPNPLLGKPQGYELPVFTDLTPSPPEEEEEPSSPFLREEEPPNKEGPPTVSGFELMDMEGFSEEKATSTDFIAGQERKAEDEKIAVSQGFKSTVFTAEKELLTDSERYSKTIREGADIYSQRKHDEADAKYAEAEQKMKEAEAIRQEALREKQRLIEEGQAQVESIKDAAYQEGFAAGKEAGTQQRYTELAPQVAQINDILDQLSRLRQIVRFQGEQEMLQLSVLIAKKVVHEELTVNTEVLYNIAKESLQEIEAFGKIRVLVHPDDYEFLKNAQTRLEQYLKEEQRLVIEPNIDAEPGALLVETDETIVNFHFEKQFEAIEEALSRKLSDRQSHIHDVDMDNYDYSLPSELEENAEYAPT